MGSLNFKELLGNAETQKVIPANDYDAVVDRVDVRESGKGKTMFAVMFKVEGGPNNGAPVWTNLTISPESPVALGIFFRQMAALGLDADYFAADPLPTKVAEDLKGALAKIKVEVGEWQGAPKNEVKSIRARAGAAPRSIPAPSGDDASGETEGGAKPSPKKPF